MAVYPFLSEQWITEAQKLRAEFADRMPPPVAQVKINVIISDIPHRDGDLLGHIDSSDGSTIIEQGHMGNPALTITLDYATARAAFVTQEPQAVMEAFLGGRIYVEGDASQLLALQAAPPEPDPVMEEVSGRIKAMTATDQ